MTDKEFMFYMISPYRTSKPDGTMYKNFSEAKDAAERFSEKENRTYYIVECCMVCNTVAEMEV